MKIIINADDFGLTKATNHAVFELARLGTLTSTTVMVNMPYALEAKDLLEIPNFSVGLHFNLTQGKPILASERVPTLVNAEGKFHDIKTLSRKAKAKEISADEIFAELSAQYEGLAKIIGDRITHIDSHQGLNRIPFIFPCVLKFCQLRKVPALRFYTKYYAKSLNHKPVVEKPSLLNIHRYGIKRVLVELYLAIQKRRLDKVTSSPNGMLVTPSHHSMDVFKWIVKNNQVQVNDLCNIIVEIPCHPAASTDGLTETKYLQERVDEYNYLKSTEFIQVSKMWSFVDYRSVKQSVQ